MIRRSGLLYLVALFSFVYGLSVAHYEIFPFHHLRKISGNVSAFLIGDEVEDLSVTQKLVNDFDISPERQIRNYFPENPVVFKEIALDGIKSRRALPRVWVSPAAPDTYRLIAGGFDFEDAFWGALLLDPSGKVMHRWKMNGQIPGLSQNPDILKNLYGLDFLPDGSAIFTMQERSGGIIKIDVCSNVEWVKEGEFHHVASLVDDNSAFWTFGGGQGDLHPILLLLDSQNGNLVQEIDMANVEKANPDIHIFDLQREKNGSHATHPNDIEPLPASLKQVFPQFKVGDLLVSYHTTNLIFVLDPMSLKIKWWYMGAGDGQHDPDWQKNGTISLFNNNSKAKLRGVPSYSTIVAIDPVTNTHKVIVNGKEANFYSHFNGHHFVTDQASILITSSTQGRAFETDIVSGEAIFEFINAYDWKEGRALHLSETFVIDKKVAERWASTNCTDGKLG